MNFMTRGTAIFQSTTKNESKITSQNRNYEKRYL